MKKQSLIKHVWVPILSDHIGTSVVLICLGVLFGLFGVSRFPAFEGFLQAELSWPAYATQILFMSFFSFHIVFSKSKENYLSVKEARFPTVIFLSLTTLLSVTLAIYTIQEDWPCEFNWPDFRSFVFRSVYSGCGAVLGLVLLGWFLKTSYPTLLQLGQTMHRIDGSIAEYNKIHEPSIEQIRTYRDVLNSEFSTFFVQLMDFHSKYPNFEVRFFDEIKKLDQIRGYTQPDVSPTTFSNSVAQIKSDADALFESIREKLV
ncbi:hypothetical protein [Cognatiyoonia sp. IB215182]|uniref:hypothetical protein n=1 Tax=Cognatiyoonia sp. IB215182 TaxID=3097353 RepID=UPI002A0CEC79|nr:hypothetical protein [Cognatiyoonia sp. IB215182]MDX8353997.1 hypothetical protein [Cognatiyoonia sp. IB215182]